MLLLGRDFLETWSGFVENEPHFKCVSKSFHGSMCYRHNVVAAIYRNC